MGFFDRFKKSGQLNNTNQQYIDTGEIVDLPEGKIVAFDSEVLDTTSKLSLKKFKHNLEVLIEKTKETGKVDKFMLIREDDFFPDGWEWKVLSKNTNLEKVSTPLSYELKKAYALEQSGIASHTEVMGIKVPNASQDQTMQALSKVDKQTGSILLPSKFRSTKHYTINTPLAVTGDYNSVSTNRDYIIIDDVNAFLNSGYGYSVSYHDAYLDISHESLPVSQNAVVLINDENYERIISDEKVSSQLAQRRVVRFKGDEVIAINMILTEMGALPSKIGSLYAEYDNEIYDILDNSIRELADKNGLFFDKSHAGPLKPDGGHFSNYYDEKNQDYQKAINEFIVFLRKKFPEQEKLFPEGLILTKNNSEEIVEKLGTTNLLAAINEYNELADKRLAKTLSEYKQDRESITPEIHQQFVETITLINKFYKSNMNNDEQIEAAIQSFMQGETVSQQLEAAKRVCELLPSKKNDKNTILQEAVTNALKETSRDKANEASTIENTIERLKVYTEEGARTDD